MPTTSTRLGASVSSEGRSVREFEASGSSAHDTLLDNYTILIDTAADDVWARRRAEILDLLLRLLSASGSKVRFRLLIWTGGDVMDHTTWCVIDQAIQCPPEFCVRSMLSHLTFVNSWL